MQPGTSLKAGITTRNGSYGPLIKSPDEALPQNTQQDQSSAKGENS
jgi:hypothetical protein